MTREENALNRNRATLKAMTYLIAGKLVVLLDRLFIHIEPLRQLDIKEQAIRRSAKLREKRAFGGP